MTENKYIVIAIDGPAASGKGTIAKKIASDLGFKHLDTGKLYRAVGYKTAKIMPGFENAMLGSNEFIKLKAQATDIAKNLTIEDTSMADIETEEVGRYASIVSTIMDVRAALLDFQRNFAKYNPKTPVNGAVLDGRDIGTVIAPDATFKFFITASPEIRANRRYLQLHKQGKDVNEVAILLDILERDKRDSERKNAPLKAAEDAIVVDTSSMSVTEVFDKCMKIIRSKNSA